MIRKILKCIGCNLVEISINWSNGTEAAHIKRLFQTINKYIGVNIRTLEIGTRGLNLLSETLLQEIQPMLNRIQTLKLSFFSTCNFPLHLLCPNLEKLDLLFYSSWKNFSTWSSLTRLSISQNSMPFESLQAFLLMNPQIKKLKYASTTNTKTVLEFVSHCLDNIERLSIGIDRNVQNEIGSADFYASGLQQLAVKHKNLKKLSLFEISQGEISGVLKSLQLHENLIGLKLTFYPFYGVNNEEYVTIDVEAFSHVVQKLNKLETLLIGFANLDESIIVHIVHFCGTSLKELHLHMCNMPPLNNLLLDKIENAKKANHQLCTISPLKLFVDDETIENIENEKNRSHLLVRRGCDHSAIW